MNRLMLRASRVRALSTIASESASEVARRASVPLSSATRALADGLAAGERRALAKAITLVESSAPAHRDQAHALLAHVRRAVPAERFDALRVGVTGPPGVGKSTFIEAFGCYLADEHAKRVAVLAIDPSSTRTGGSILGDKTRMEKLSQHPSAYVRPSPTRGSLGGVARQTAAVATLCAAAGFDALLIETVGVGQSEIAVADMCDVFLLLAAAGGGDELQGIKKGVMELADIVVVNKADSNPPDAMQRAHRCAADISSALRLVRPKKAVWHPRTLLCSAAERRGLADIWTALTEFEQANRASGDWTERRLAQNRRWFETLLAEQLWSDFSQSERVQRERRALELAIDANRVTPGQAADRLIALYLDRKQ